MEMTRLASHWRLQVLEKGQPEGTMPGIAGRQVALQGHENVISGLLNSRGEKVSSWTQKAVHYWAMFPCQLRGREPASEGSALRQVPDSLSAARQRGCL